MIFPLLPPSNLFGISPRIYRRPMLRALTLGPPPVSQAPCQRSIIFTFQSLFFLRVFPGLSQFDVVIVTPPPRAADISSRPLSFIFIGKFLPLPQAFLEAAPKRFPSHFRGILTPQPFALFFSWSSFSFRVSGADDLHLIRRTSLKFPPRFSLPAEGG